MTKIEELKKKKRELEIRIAAQAEKNRIKSLPKITRKLRVAVYTDYFNTDAQDRWLISAFKDSFNFEVEPEIKLIETLQNVNADILLIDFGGYSSQGLESHADMTSREVYNIYCNKPDMFILFATTFTCDDYVVYIKRELNQEYTANDPRLAIMDNHKYVQHKDWKQTLKTWVNP